jgi:hypothetical protein
MTVEPHFIIHGQVSARIGRRIDMLATLAKQYPDKETHRVQFLRLVSELCDRNLYHHYEAMMMYLRGRKQ